LWWRRSLDFHPLTAAKFNKEILGQDKFNEFVKGKLILVDIVMAPLWKLKPEVKTRNKELAIQYGATKIPTVILADSTGKKLGELPYALLHAKP